MPPIRVLQMVTRLIVGGAQETVMYTAALLDKQRFRVDVLRGPQTGSEGSLIEEVRQRGVPLTIFPDLLREVSPAHDVAALVNLYRFIRAGRYDIVHTNSSKAGILGRIAARLARAPVIVHTVHGWSFHDYMSPAVRNTYILLEKLTASFCDALIVVTSRDIEKGLQHGIGQPQQYRLIRSAIPLDEFDLARGERVAVRRELGIPLDAPLLGNIGRFSAQKNPLDWVRIAGRVGRALPECRFLLVGDGPLRAQVVELLASEGIADRTVMTGLRRDVPRLLSAMDVFLLTSLWEGLPRVIPQAMAMEIPVVASSVDGSSEAIICGETGYICPPTDLDGLAARCLELLADAEKRKRIGLRGRQFVWQEFDIRRMLVQIEQLYEQLHSKS